MPNRSDPRISERETPVTAVVGTPLTAMVSEPGPGGADTARRNRETKGLFDAFQDAVARLERILELETERLGRHDVSLLREVNHEKRLGLFELTRALNALRGRDCLALGFDVGPALARLRGKLEANLSCLDMHMKAVGEIAAIVVKAIVEQESDGTYSAGAHGTGRQG